MSATAYAPWHTATTRKASSPARGERLRPIRSRQTACAGIPPTRRGPHRLGGPREIARAIGNLLANGVREPVRRAPDDSTILIRADTLDDNHLVLSIIDQGAGVAAENLGRMFDVGWRADTSRTTTAPGNPAGAGLGLAIVRGIVEAHGGSARAHHTSDGFQLDLLLPTAPA